MHKNPLHGLHTALVTPFSQNKICFNSLEKLIQHQLSDSIQGILISGTTGEAPTLSTSEFTELLHAAKNQIQNKALLIAGTTSNSTAHAIELAQLATKAGADYLLTATPYYNKPSQEGLFLHFSAIAESTDKPIILYSIPSRCCIEIEVATIHRLRKKYPHIVAIKECNPSPNRVTAIKNALDYDFTVLSGCDTNALPYMAAGAKGLISVSSNLLPNPLSSMIHKALDNDFLGAQTIHAKYFNLFSALLSIDTNPIPIKHALHHHKLISSPELRLPLFPLSKENASQLEKLLNSLEN